MDFYMVEFHDLSRNTEHDIQLPAFLTGNELVHALQEAYELKIDLSDPGQVYLRAENPIALIMGEDTLQALGISNGTSIYFDPR